MVAIYNNEALSDNLMNYDSKKSIHAYKRGEEIIRPTGEILLELKRDIDINTIIEIAEGKISVSNRTNGKRYVMNVDDWSELFNISNKIYKSGFVRYCQPNFFSNANICINDPLYAEQFYLNNTGQFGGTAGFDINAPQAWGYTKGLRPIKVAVIGTGVESHEDLYNRVLTGFTPTDPYGYGNPADPSPPDNVFNVGHEQAVAGIIAASHNLIGIAGISPFSEIVPINIFNDWYPSDFDSNWNVIGVGWSEDNDDIADAINFAWETAEVDVINCSFGMSYYENIAAEIDEARTEGRNGLGCVVVAASGNETTVFKAVKFPANHIGVVTVGAITKNGNLFDYSCRGPEMDLVAPSGELGIGIVTTTDRMGENGYTDGNYGRFFGGTSATAPQVAGAAALMLSLNPSLTELEVVSILRYTATDMGDNGFDNDYGFGRLNLQAAIEEVISDIKIIGNNYICTSSTVSYSISNYPTGCTTNWTLSSNLKLVTSGNNYIVVEKTKPFLYGSASIAATINGSYGSITLPTKQIWMGVPSTPVTLPTGYPTYQMTLAEITTITVSSAPGASTNSYNWNVTGSIERLSSTPKMSCTVEATSLGTGNFYVTSSNTCGTSSTGGGTVNVTTEGGEGPPHPLSITPNPANGEIEITITEDSENKILIVEGTSEDLRYDLVVYSNSGFPVYSGKVKNNKVNINVSGWNKGLYHVKATGKNKIYTGTLLVE